MSSGNPDPLARETAMCQCGGRIVMVDNVWQHYEADLELVREHTPVPLVHQPVPDGHVNAHYLNGMATAEVEARRWERDGVVDARVAEFDAESERILVRGAIPDTRAEWYYNRLRRQGSLGEGVDSLPWNRLPEMDREFWQHEIEAIARMIQRNGFKDYDPARSSL